MFVVDNYLNIFNVYKILKFFYFLVAENAKELLPSFSAEIRTVLLNALVHHSAFKGDVEGLEVYEMDSIFLF
jgi:hypothetical protein